MFKFIKKQNINKKGFSLVETLVALFVFSIAITATMTVMSQGVTNINSAKNKITASFLAQEGIEQIRNMRDTHILFAEDKNLAWIDFAVNPYYQSSNPGPCTSNNFDYTWGCYLDYEMVQNDYDPGFCDDTYWPFFCPSLKYDEQKGVFGYSSGVDTKFHRNIAMIVVDDVNFSMKVASTVSWKEGNVIKKITLIDYLTGWPE